MPLFHLFDFNIPEILNVCNNRENILKLKHYSVDSVVIHFRPTRLQTVNHRLHGNLK